MATNEYHVVSHWRVPGTVEEVYDLLIHIEDYPRWWPEVFVGVRRLRVGHSRAVGQAAVVRTHGFLPYTLRFRATLTESFYPNRFAFEVTGDFVGGGIFTLEQDGEFVKVVFDWRIRAEKPLVRRLSWLLKPLFTANHRWSMRRGAEQLKRELARRAAGAASGAWLWDYEEALQGGRLALEEI